MKAISYIPYITSSETKSIKSNEETKSSSIKSSEKSNEENNIEDLTEDDLSEKDFDLPDADAVAESKEESKEESPELSELKGGAPPKKMKVILIEIENSGYNKEEIIEACQYARQFKGIMNGRDGVIGHLRTKNPGLSEDEITGKFERLMVISSLFQQKCKDDQIFSGRDENSLKSEYKFANGINNRPGLRLTYIPQEALEMFKKHNATQAVEFSATPAFAIINTPLRLATPRLI
jgi:hypothetical protein